MNKNNSQRAFTLPEVLITLSVTVIVVFMITSLVIIVSNVSKTQIYNQNCQAEYQKAETFVEEFVSTYSYGNFAFDVNQTENGTEIVAQNGEETYKLVYQKIQNSLTAQILNALSGEAEQKTIPFDNVTNIAFEKQYNVIKCTYYFENYPTFSKLVVFGVA